ncbi:ATP10 protein-domain-containing protein [Copromyces sp. CBS 386.78]|nr:ATP10 protein-domain-containing protein [Copromyces sp. CBS 386.78]
MLSRATIRARPTASACLLCQWRSFSVSYQRLADKTPSPQKTKPTTPATTPASTPAPAPDAASKDATSKDTAPAAPVISPIEALRESGPLANAPRAYGKALDTFTPTHLSRPIGMHNPPNPGENTGIDTRTLQQKRDDFVNYEKHLKKREMLKSKISRPYFRDWRNMQFHKGKTFLAPPRLFKADLSLYFPNLHGRTLAKDAAAKAADTTPLLEGHCSVVTVFSSMWAENQIRTFVAPEANPALQSVLKQSGGRAQLVQVNIEEDAMKAWLVRLFMGSLRKKVDKDDWKRYFLVTKGITDEIRESIGLLNSKVGYTYLVDHNCRIRWAGSGDAEGDEKEGLVKGVQRILDEMTKEGVGKNYVRKTAAVPELKGETVAAQ